MRAIRNTGKCRSLPPCAARAPLAPPARVVGTPARRCVVSYVSSNNTNVKASEPGLYETMAKVNAIKALADSDPTLKKSVLEPKRFTNDLGERVGFICLNDVPKDGVILAIPEDLAVTSIDAEKQELVGAMAADCGELISLTLWLIAERSKGTSSAYASLITTLPERTNSPLLWSESEISTLLQGSPVVEESKKRITELKNQWQVLHDNWFSKDPETFKPDIFGYDQFAAAFCVVMAHAVYLPSAQMFALLPIASLMGRTGNGNGSYVDYDSESQRVVVMASRPYREGQEVLLSDERPNGELLMVTGTIPDSNMADFLYFPASLIPADKYYIMKNEILASMGFGPQENFPVYADRMPNQLLAYVRLGRISDPALFAKMNEYEVLQLLMGDCRERLATYRNSLEEDIKISQQQGQSPKEKLAVKLRLTEKRIISSTMDAVRKRLAPIRGIPTKQGFQDPNSDFNEIFETLEAIPAAPKALIDGFMSWARGEQDPDWGKPPPKKELPKRPW